MATSKTIKRKIRIFKSNEVLDINAFAEDKDIMNVETLPVAGKEFIIVYYYIN